MSDDGLPVAERAGSPVSPFLRWAGSKRRLLKQILPLFPTTFNRYIEPFLGSGAVFLALQPMRATLGDACRPLVETWEAVASDPEDVWAEANRRELTKEQYYEARGERGGTAAQAAGRFIYLNRGAFNGLYRVNKRGEFNVPWGAPKTPNIISKEALQDVSSLLARRSVTFAVGDFQPRVDRACSGDLVFVDPPYVTGHNNNGFIAYNESIFSWHDQERLAKAAQRASARGAHVFISNANHPAIIELYKGFQAVRLTRPSTIAASSGKRGKVEEVLLHNRAH